MRILMNVVALVGLFTFPTFALAQDLTLKRVMLSSGGLGYFEYEANVDGDASLKLTVSLGQVDDVLKSLVVYDDKGSVGGLSLPGREPLAQAFKDLPFDQNALGSPAELLQTLKGAQVTVGGSRSISGRIVAVEEDSVALPDGKGTVKRIRPASSSMVGSGRFSAATWRKIPGMPLPHCSIKSNSRNTRAMTGLRIWETPCLMSSMVRPGRSRPGLSTSIRLSKKATRMGVPRWE